MDTLFLRIAFIILLIGFSLLVLNAFFGAEIYNRFSKDKKYRDTKTYNITNIIFIIITAIGGFTFFGGLAYDLITLDEKEDLITPGEKED